MSDTGERNSADSTALFLTLVHLIAKEVGHDSCSFFNPHKTHAAEQRLQPNPFFRPPWRISPKVVMLGDKTGSYQYKDQHL